LIDTNVDNWHGIRTTVISWQEYVTSLTSKEWTGGLDNCDYIRHTYDNNLSGTLSDSLW